VLRSIHETIRRQGLLNKESHVVVGVSSGADSVALLYALHFLRKRLGIRLAVAHLNHGIRGKAADRDEEFVRQLAWRLGLSFVSEHADVPALAKRRGISIEMAARAARYDFFARAMRATGSNVLATAHTADDQAETVLLRFLRGAGPQGLGGMAYRSDRDGLIVIRPMLDATHADAVQFLKRHRLRWREDASNRDTDFLRNRVRHELLPLLEKKFNPQIRRALIRMSSILREENEWMDATIKAKTKRDATLNAGALRKLPLAVRRRLVVQWLLLNEVEADAVDFDVVERVLHLAGKSTGTSTVPVSRRFRVARRYENLSVERVGKQDKAFSVRLKVPGETALAGCGLVAGAAYAKGFKPTPSVAYLSRAVVGTSPLIMRSWRAGDRMRPLGMKGTKKVQDIFGDLKVPRDERARVPVLVCRGEVVWVAGYRIARGWEVVGPGSPSLCIGLGTG
jgi:tRNA(Ile)-lysidine synthase